MKCYYTLFTKTGLIKNIGSYILLFTILLIIISGLLFYKCGYPLLEEEIYKIINSKEEENNKKKINIKETIDIKGNIKNKKIKKKKSKKEKQSKEKKLLKKTYKEGKRNKTIN